MSRFPVSSKHEPILLKTYLLPDVDSQQVLPPVGEANVVGDLVEIVDYLIIMDDSGQMVPVDGFGLENGKD